VGGRYVILHVAGEGAMGSVYRAQDLQTNAYVALKIVRVDDAHLSERFEEEARMLAGINHPRIVRYVDHGAIDRHTRYLAMEWLDGLTLHYHIRSQGLTLHESLKVARQMAEGLQVLHESGIVHRDIKPHNVMFKDEVSSPIKLLDLGVARPIGPRHSEITATGIAVGSLSYMSPEQARAEAVDERADLFALGCVLFECLTGVAAFSGEDAAATQLKVMLAPPPPLATLNPEASPQLRALVTQLLEKDRGARPASAREVLERLATLNEVKGKRRPRRTVDVSELVATGDDLHVMEDMRSLERTSILVVASQEAEEPSDADRFSELASRCGATLQRLPGVWTLGLQSLEDPAALTAKGVQCAVAVAKAFPKAVVAVAASYVGRDENTLSDRATRLIARVTQVDRAAPRGVRLDPALWPHLGAPWDIRRAPDGTLYLGDGCSDAD